MNALTLVVKSIEGTVKLDSIYTLLRVNAFSAQLWCSRHLSRALEGSTGESSEV